MTELAIDRLRLVAADAALSAAQAEVGYSVVESADPDTIRFAKHA